MADKYSKIENLINTQKQKKDKILEIFENIFNKNLGLENKININIIFQNTIKIQIKEKSSIKFVILKNSSKIKEEYAKFFPEDILSFF